AAAIGVPGCTTCFLIIYLVERWRVACPGGASSKRPVDDAVGPFRAVGRRDFDIIVRIPFHHGCLDMSFEQYLPGLAGVAARKVLHLHKRQIAQEFIAFLADGYRDHGFQLEGAGIVALGIGEDVEVGDVEGLQKVYRFFKQLVGLAGESYDDVDADGAMGHGGFDQPDPFRIELSPVTAAHETQQPVAAALQGDMKMGHEMPARGYPFDHFGGEQVGFDRGDAIAVDAFDLVERLHQVEEILAADGSTIWALPEIAEVDAGKHDLADVAAGGQLFHGLYRCRHGVAAATAAGHGDGAEGTAVVTAILYLEEGTGAVTQRIRGVEAGDNGDIAAADLRGVAFGPFFEMLDDVEFLRRAKDEIDAGNIGDLAGF